MSRERHLAITRGSSQLKMSQGLLVLPKGEDHVRIGVESIFTTPLYWELPPNFLGDKVASYNGFLRFRIRSNGPRPYSLNVLDEFPLVQMQGNGRIVLEHFPRKTSNSGRYEVRCVHCAVCLS